MGSVFDRKQHRDELRHLDTTPNRHNKRKISTTLPWRALSHSLHPRDREPCPERRASLPAQSRASRHLSRECAPAQTTESRAIQKPLTLYGGPRSVDNVLDPRFISGKDLRISDILSPRRQYAPMISSFMSKMAFYELMEFSVANSKKPYRNYGDLSATSKSGRKQTFSVVVSRQYLGPAASTIPTTVAHGSLAMFGSSAVSASAPAVMTAGVSSTDDMTKRKAGQIPRSPRVDTFSGILAMPSGTSLHVQKGPTLHRVETAPPTNLAVTLGTTETRHTLPGTTVTSTAAQRKRKSPSPENANAGVPHLHVPLSGSWPTCLGHYRPASEASRRPPQFEAVVNHRATSLALVSRACCFREGAELEQPQYVTMLLLIVGRSTLRSRLEMPYARPHLQ
ncbi:hypothetical protein CTAM01_00750 [Colletotrichum tamarilloi]|uniref:Uncharacterized protein n=1 Tax=Colletotrichum tamarilloi TaxID=1209934 RepID=A0ABQ9RSV0_9PEZI|nr:uncharacterized protein CTAM01_00750 [Colletotrichum tamarilloi]KAK1511820.1 hypothetical protein CTAM01_00750 [Colletotrichum tamarilloi]